MFEESEIGLVGGLREDYVYTFELDLDDMAFGLEAKIRTQKWENRRKRTTYTES